MFVRKSEMKDLDNILKIYEYARNQMKLNGNPTQWGDNKPTRETIINDINNGQSYVIEEDGKLYGVFAFIIGEDSTYQVIDGNWLNDEIYGTIHRVASNGKKNDILKCCIDFCETQINNIKIDTHHNNKIMQHLVKKYGFLECGIIYVEDNTPRIAYQKLIK